MKNNIRKKDENLRNISKHFIKEVDLEPNLKYEISKFTKEKEQTKKNNKRNWKY